MNKLIAIVYVSMILPACAQRVEGGGDSPTFSAKVNDIACEAVVNEYVLDTTVVGFESTSTTNIDAGFDDIGPLGFFGLDFKTQSGRLTMRMDISLSEMSQGPSMSVLGKASLKDRAFQFNLGYNGIGINFEHYSETPMSTLAEKALRDSLKNLKESLQGYEAEWRTYVSTLLPGTNRVKIRNGSAFGLKKGDTFNVYNVDHDWEGEPCASEYRGYARTTSHPLATAVVAVVRGQETELDIFPYLGEELAEPIRVGAELTIQNLEKRIRTEQKELSRSLRLNPVKGASIKFDKDLKADFSNYLDQQIRPIVYEFGFVIRDN